MSRASPKIDKIPAVEIPCTGECEASIHGSYCTNCGKTLLDIKKWRYMKYYDKKNYIKEIKRNYPARKY